MKKHTKIYINFWGITSADEYMPCEWCMNSAVVDINHIEPRGMGGKNKAVDNIENLVGMCRPCHLQFESKKIGKDELRNRHLEYIKNYS